MKKFLIFIILFSFTSVAFTQHEFYCPVEGPDLPKDTGQESSREVESCDDCGFAIQKTIKLLFHIIGDENGEHNFGPGDEYFIQGIVDKANEKLSNNQPASHPGIPNQPVVDINIQYELSEIRFYQETNWAFPNIDYPALDPDFLDIMMVEQSGDWFGTGCNDPNYCTGALCCAGGWTGLGNLDGRAVLNEGFYRYTVENLQPNCYAIFGGDTELAWFNFYADVLIHEIGHMTGLRHIDEDDGCEDTPELSNVCSSNNFMSGCACAKASFTCCQIGRMHDAFESEDFPFVVLEEESPLPVPIFHFEDSNGEEKTEFCFGEEIFLNGLASINETRHFIEIGIINTSNEPEGYPDTTIWTSIDALINLTDLLALIGPAGNTYFKPGYNYRVKLAVGNSCDPWEEDTMEFVIRCCNDEFSAHPKFILDDDDHDIDHYTINALAYGLFENLHPTHEWYVYSGDFPGGPFTPITIVEGDSLSFEPAEYGVEYIVIHKVITDCEERCFRTCISNGGGGGLHEGGEREMTTCLGEEIDCDLIGDIFPLCNALMAPANLQAVAGVLSWDPVPGAVGYEVTIQVGGSSLCHCSGDFPSSFTISTTTNSLPVFLNICFQWSVVANCGEETNSMPSQQACYFPGQLFGESATSREGEISQNEFTENSFSVFPNPANDYFEVSNTSANDASIDLYHINGQLIITNENIQAMSTVTVNTKHLAPGLYLLNIRNKINGQLISTQKIIVQR